MHQELRRKGVTVVLPWQEYSAQVGDEHCADNPVKARRCSQFSENYRQFAKRLKRSMRQSHRAGEKMFINHAGPTIALIEHGVEVGRANIFVAAMAASGYSFALATPRQTAADWLHGTACALGFFGGVPQRIVPDNPRALVTQSNRYEPLLTDSVLDFARHCGCSVLPTRAYHPQDKARVVLKATWSTHCWRWAAWQSQFHWRPQLTNLMKDRSDMSKVVVYEVDVMFGDCDPAGIVFFRISANGWTPHR